MFQDNIDKIRLFFRKEKEPFLRLYKILGFYPHNIQLYQEALMHKSVSQHATGKRINNERLEYLGDAILGAVVADVLYKRYCRKQEGFLTTLRSKIVKRESLNKLAVSIGLDKLVLHNGEVSSAHNSYMNGNAFEAFFGAIYLDRGYKYCMMFMEKQIFGKHIDIDEISRREENFKSKIIEWCQKNQLSIEFEIEKEMHVGDKNVPKFDTIIKIEGINCGSGSGYSKKESHQRAAQQALLKIRRNKSFADSLKNAKVIAEEAAKEECVAEDMSGSQDINIEQKSDCPAIAHGGQEPLLMEA